MLLHVIFSFIVSMFFQSPTYETSASSVKYSMVHKLHSWEGVSKELKVATKWNEQKNEIEQISIVVNVATFNSGLFDSSATTRRASSRNAAALAG